MYRIAVVLLACAAPGFQTLEQPPAANAIDDALLRLLKRNPELLSLNQGFQSFLRMESDFGAIEKTYMGMAALPSFRDAAGPFEEALAGDRSAWDRFLRYNTYLGNNPKAREQVDTLLRLEMNRPGLRRELGPGLAYLRAHPDDAVLFSRNPALLAQLPEALYSLRNRFRTDPGLQGGIQDSFKTLAELPGARSEIFPWWEAAYGNASELGKAARGLDEYLIRNPAFLWSLRTRNIQWASEPGAFAWTQYLHGIVRREPGLAQPFYKALGIAIGASSAIPAAGTTGSAKAIGLSANLPSWPPPDRPPELKPQLPSTRIEIRRPARPTLRERPAGPQAKFPTPPTRPRRPAKP